MKKPEKKRYPKKYSVEEWMSSRDIVMSAISSMKKKMAFIPDIRRLLNNDLKKAYEYHMITPIQAFIKALKNNRVDIMKEVKPYFMKQLSKMPRDLSDKNREIFLDGFKEACENKSLDAISFMLDGKKGFMKLNDVKKVKTVPWNSPEIVLEVIKYCIDMELYESGSQWVKFDHIYMDVYTVPKTYNSMINLLDNILIHPFNDDMRNFYTKFIKNMAFFSIMHFEESKFLNKLHEISIYITDFPMKNFIISEITEMERHLEGDDEEDN